MKRTETIAKCATIAVSVGGLIWTVVFALETRAVDSRRPFLNLQLRLYQEAARTAATLSTATDAAALRSAQIRFWELYWGELAMVENGGIATNNGGVEGAMVRFGRQLDMDPKNQSALHQQSLCLSHMLRDSLAFSWGVKDWRAPDYGATSEYKKCIQLDEAVLTQLGVQGPRATKR